MTILGGICLLIAVVVGLIYGIQLIILAFKTSTLWGLAYLFIPFAAIVFIIKYWDDAKTPFLRSLIAIPFAFIGSILLSGNSTM